MLEQPRVKAFASLAVKLLILLIVIADYNISDNKRDNNNNRGAYYTYCITNVTDTDAD